MRITAKNSDTHYFQTIFAILYILVKQCNVMTSAPDVSRFHGDEKTQLKKRSAEKCDSSENIRTYARKCVDDGN